MSGTVWVANSSQASSAFGNSLRYVALRDAQSDYIEFQFCAWKPNHTIEVNYAMSSSEANAVRVRLDVLKLAAGDAPSTAATTGTAFTVTPGSNVTVQQIKSTDSADLALTSLASGRIVYCRLTRLGSDGADTHTGDMRVIEVRAV